MSRRLLTEYHHVRDRRVRAGLIALLYLLVFGMAIVVGDRSFAMAMSGMPAAFAALGGWLSLAAQPFVILPACLLLAAAGMLGPATSRLASFGLFGFCCVSASLVISLPLKHAIGRARPDAALNWDAGLFSPFAFEDAFASMPSAQSACAAAISIAAAVCFPQWRGRLYACGAILCAARIVAGDHWISDALAGWAIGWLMVQVCSWFIRPWD